MKHGISLSLISLVSSSHASRLSLKPRRRQVLTQSELISRRFCRYCRWEIGDEDDCKDEI